MTDTLSPQTLPELPSPPLWLRQFSRWFRLGLGLFLLLSVLLGTMGCSAKAASVPWRKATDIAPKPLIAQVLAQNTAVTGQEAQILADTMQAWQIQGRDGKLLLFQFNTPNLCGTLGCLYVGVWEREAHSPMQVLSSYLNPNLPPDQPLFEVTQRQSEAALPCLKVQQAESARLRRHTLCLVETRYQVVDSRLLE
jgi:hypothetical protein